LTHGDLHDENVAIAAEGDKYLPVAIDFGWSMYGIKYPRIDLIQFIRGMFFALKDKANNKENIRYMIRLLLDIYQRRYNNKLKGTAESVNREFNRVFIEYEKMYSRQFVKFENEYYKNRGKIPSIERILNQRSAKLFPGQQLLVDDSTYIDNGDDEDDSRYYL
jgi:subtilase family serine protease